MKINKILFCAFFLGLLAGRLNAEDKIPLAIATMDYPHTRSIREGKIDIPECRISYSSYSLTELWRRFESGQAGDIIEVDFAAYVKWFISEKKHDWTLVPVFLLRQFPDKPKEELIAEFKETRIFPIHTVLAVRAELVKEYPWLPEAIFRAFCEAKHNARKDGTLPQPFGSETTEIMGKNFWTYGVKDNPKSLDALAKAVDFEELFPGETLSLLDTDGGNEN